jgi:hypothetical protein
MSTSVTDEETKFSKDTIYETSRTCITEFHIIGLRMHIDKHFYDLQKNLSMFSQEANK